jgi:hypothetical protein
LVPICWIDSFSDVRESLAASPRVTKAPQVR